MAVKFERIPYMVVFDEVSAFKDTYGGAIGKVAVEAMHLKPEVPSDTVVVFSHPIGGGAWLPLVSMLARMGVHTIYANTRYRGNDSALIMERATMDFAAVIRDAKERLGYRKVYLGGWSGGGRKACSIRPRRRTRASPIPRPAIHTIWSRRNSFRRTACCCWRRTFRAT